MRQNNIYNIKILYYPTHCACVFLLCSTRVRLNSGRVINTQLLVTIGGTSGCDVGGFF